MLAATFNDLVLGLDVHFELVPMPGPVPTPIPNPFVGMVWDPGSLLSGQLMQLAQAMVAGPPPRGMVSINQMPAATVGTLARNALGVPHLLLPPGTAWAPMPKPPKPCFKGGTPPPPGPPIAPEGDAICTFGSPTVALMGTGAVRMGDRASSCGEPVRLPSSTVLAIPKGAPVIIGGPPALLVADAGGRLLRTKWLAGPLHRLLSRVKAVRLRNLLSKTVCFLTGHPVDVATGRVLTDHIEWELPGPLPLKLERNYSSAWANRSGPMGYGWSHSLDQAVWAERGKVIYLDGEGREIEFDTFDLPGRILGAGQTVFEPISRLTLKALGHRRFEISTNDGIRHCFGPAEGAGGDRQHWSPLQRMEDRGGNKVVLGYDQRGCLELVTDSVGRKVAFEHDRGRRLVAVKLPHPTESGWLTHTRYIYDQRGDLVQVTDPFGHSWRFEYKRHLLVRETNRNGLSFHFAYDGFSEDAHCVRTWGDDGLYDHLIDYDKLGKVTCVTNSLGHTTTYKMNVVGCVVQVTDALGAATIYQYDERTLHKVRQTDPEGGDTRWQYDERGNCVRTVGPDGAEVSVTFNQDSQPVEALDAVKGRWQWEYGEDGRLAGRVDPLNRGVRFVWGQDWTAGPPGHGSGDGGRRNEARRWSGTQGAKRLVGFVDPAGNLTQLGYDADGNVSSVRTPDGGERRWHHDRLGRCVTAFDAAGNAQRREHDALGRVVRVWEADGNLRQVAYDPEGNVVRARDKHHDVTFAYRGMGRLVSRTEEGTTVAFTHDTEERLTAIHNEHGHAYRFELGPTGRVAVEQGFDDIRRVYLRDKAGRVTKVFRPAGRVIDYAYDAGGRIVGVKHGDGSSETYAYRPDGELVFAKNGDAEVRLERDPLGRVTRETVGRDWVVSEYDALGMRTQVRSSKGLRQSIRRDTVGGVLGVRATVIAGGDSGEYGDGYDRDGAAHASEGGSGLEAGDRGAWEARMRRDVLGLEIERTLPGGVRARWERDAVGQPVRHEVFATDEFRRAVQYTWDVGDRLRMVVDATRGPTRYEHDGLGRLAAANYADGSIDQRTPDAVGNLFRTGDRGDRKYGPAGQLLESRRQDGRVTRYRYDAEGNLVQRWDELPSDGGGGEGAHTSPGGHIWHYQWNSAGLLTRVVRPDGEGIEFTYDALARRLSKTFRGRITRWSWDGHVPLHEWVEGPETLVAAPTTRRDSTTCDEESSRRREAERASRPAQGPPPTALTTWLFEPETFTPLAKLGGAGPRAILADHLGTPQGMYDAGGDLVWSATIAAYGDLRDVTGGQHACPLRWPGQYEDEETGLHYNRFRYYDPGTGGYLSQDPLGPQAGMALYSYASDTATRFDPFGLSECRPSRGDPLPGEATIHRIGGADPSNLVLKGAERRLSPVGISVLRAQSAHEAGILAKTVARQKGWTRMETAAGTMGSATATDIRLAGFDVVHDPTTIFGDAHARLIHPQGEAGFTPGNLERLSHAFSKTSGL